MITPQQLIAYFRRAVAEKWGYVWSLNGELYTQAMAQKFHNANRSTSSWRDPATYWLIDCARWVGKMAADCSGGIVGAIRADNPSYDDRGANTFYSQCTDKGPVSTIPEIPGLCVWRDGHIGIYEGNGYVLEFRGTEYGAVRTKLAERNFTNWGKLRDVDYGDQKEEPKMAKVITITKPFVADEGVRLLQVALNALGYPCGEEDGKAGDKTMAGIAAFCAAHGEAQAVPVALPDAVKITINVGGTPYEVEAKRA